MGMLDLQRIVLLAARFGMTDFRFNGVNQVVVEFKSETDAAAFVEALKGEQTDAVSRLGSTVIVTAS